jgi:hypothetical protein
VDTVFDRSGQWIQYAIQRSIDPDTTVDTRLGGERSRSIDPDTVVERAFDQSRSDSVTVVFVTEMSSALVEAERGGDERSVRSVRTGYSM